MYFESINFRTHKNEKNFEQILNKTELLNRLIDLYGSTSKDSVSFQNKVFKKKEDFEKKLQKVKSIETKLDILEKNISKEIVRMKNENDNLILTLKKKIIPILEGK